jgi:hypothetical protein
MYMPSSTPIGLMVVEKGPLLGGECPCAQVSIIVLRERL